MKLPESRYLNSYVAGILLGLILLAAFLTLGAGLGASGGLARLAAAVEVTVAPSHTLASPYFGAWGESPGRYYLVYMLAGIFLGGLLSALGAGRLYYTVERGRRCSSRLRLVLAAVGGLLVGIASRLAQGCTSGQALTGGALLLSGSLVFLAVLFATGYATAWLFRGQWHD